MAKQNYNHNKRGQKGRGNKPMPKSNDRSPKEEARGDINNPAFYYESETVLNQLMNFSFNEFGGVGIDMTTNPGSQVSYYNPMICSYAINPSLPPLQTTSTNTSGTTTAALRNFMYLTATNNRSIPYAAQDLFILECAIADMLSTSSFLTRTFGFSWLFNYRNRDYPEKLFLACGIDFDDFKKKQANYRIEYNRLLTLAQKIPFPANIPAFAKSANMYSNIYLDDEDSALAQTYILVPYSVWVFDEAYDSNGAGLKTTLFVDGTVRTFDYYLQVFEAQINALLNSTSLNYIYSDILRLQQKGTINTMLGFAPIPENLVVKPVYNKEVETWFHNAIIVGAPLATASHHSYGGWFYSDKNDVSCDANTNKIKYQPQFNIPGEAGFAGLIDFDHDGVTAEDKVRATRFSARWLAASDGTQWFTADICLSDHYIVKMSVFYGTNVFNLTNSWMDVSSMAVASVVGRVANITKFDWAPIIYAYTGNDPTTARPIGDLDYYTVIDKPFVEKIYDYEVIHYYQIG